MNNTKFSYNSTEVGSTGSTHVTYLFGAYEEKPELVYIAYILGILIILSNLPVVISSGLILKKGKKPKNTYILLGNVALADTMLGSTIIFGVSYPTKTHDPTCILLIGLLVCPAMVSICSVGLIAVDRYIYIIHGLYYDRWFNTTRVRCGIVVIWILGIILSFLPGFGWINKQPNFERCYYITLFPEELILLNSFISIIPIVIVVILYGIILVKALKTVNSINRTAKINEDNATSDKPKLRMNRGTVNIKRNSITKTSVLKRSASFDIDSKIAIKIKCKSKSIEDLTNYNCKEIKLDIHRNNRFLSLASITTDETSVSRNSITNSKVTDKSTNFPKIKYNRQTNVKEPNKWRAITVVILTSGSFIITWLPFFVTVIFFVFCENKTDSKCIHYGDLSSRSLCILGFCNSLLNPLIYAWWHKGFKNSVKTYYKKLFHKSITEISFC